MRLRAEGLFNERSLEPIDERGKEYDDGDAD